MQARVAHPALTSVALGGGHRGLFLVSVSHWPSHLQILWRCLFAEVLFEHLLFHAGRCLMRVPLVRRRELLAEVCEKLDGVVAFSPAVIGAGTALFQAAVAARHEGVMAKQLMSVYRPGKRSSTWKKIKPPTGRRCSQRDIFSH